jgi:hypothetical protein
MEQESEIINRVTNSSLITFDLEAYYQPGDRVLLDIKDQLYQELVLKEKEFRSFIKEHNWSQYQNKFVAVTCSADAIIPTWAYMLVAVALKPYAKVVVLGTLEQLEEKLFDQTLAKINWEQFRSAKVVVKGCSKIAVPSSAYFTVAANLKPLVTSLMFGEACSTVPIYKQKQ